jgi:hypothetical protein
MRKKIGKNEKSKLKKRKIRGEHAYVIMHCRSSSARTIFLIFRVTLQVANQIEMRLKIKTSGQINRGIVTGI